MPFLLDRFEIFPILHLFVIDKKRRILYCPSKNSMNWCNRENDGVWCYDKKNLPWFGLIFIQLVVCFLSPRQGSGIENIIRFLWKCFLYVVQEIRLLFSQFPNKQNISQWIVNFYSRAPFFFLFSCNLIGWRYIQQY